MTRTLRLNYMPEREPLFEPPNLDIGLADEDECLEAASVFDLYSDYCVFSASARKCRKQGNIHDAKMWEDEADKIYAKLPRWARW